MSKKIAVIGIPGKWSTETLADTVEQATQHRLVVDMAEVRLDLATNALLYKDINLCEYDALIVKKISEVYSPNTLDRLELLRVAEQQGVRVFSRAESIIRLIDRLSCTVTLRNHGIPMPATTVTECIEQAQQVIHQYGSAILKPLYSTKARGMTLMESNSPTLHAEIAAFKQNNPMMYIQQRAELPGKDLGLVFVGGNYYGAYARVKQNDAWNTTIHSGGKYAGHEVSQDIIDLAYKAQSLFNLDSTTVDVAETKDGPIVFEVSAFGGFRGAKEGIGIDLADLYVNHVLSELK